MLLLPRYQYFEELAADPSELGFRFRHRVIARLSRKSTSANTLDISEFKLGGRIPGGYGL